MLNENEDLPNACDFRSHCTNAIFIRLSQPFTRKVRAIDTKDRRKQGQLHLLHNAEIFPFLTPNFMDIREQKKGFFIPFT